MNISTQNNFDLIRLFAATQVAVSHISSHLGFENIFLGALSLFPGVPIFFFISGFLIYGSYEKSIGDDSPLYNFFSKRVLRLYPALILCLIFSIVSVWLTGYFSSIDLGIGEFLVWVTAQASFLQFYNPDFLRGYGVGVLNGSLWTISVELQFYALTPILFVALNRMNRFSVLFLLGVFLTINILNSVINDGNNVLFKLVGVSFLPWLYMFILGALLYKNQHIIDYINRIPAVIVFAIFLVGYGLTKSLGWGNSINPFGYVLLIALIIKLAFTLPHLSDKILRRNDFSYAIYIFHMPIVNFLIFMNISGIEGFIYAITFTFISAAVSWTFVEKPALRFKRHSLRRL